MNKGNKRKKKMLYGLAIATIVLITSATAYATSGDYKNWLADNLKVAQKDTNIIDQSVIDKGIEMRIVSYYRMDNTVTMLLTFEQIDGSLFTEYTNIDDVKILENTNCNGDILGYDSTLSDDSKKVLTTLTMNVSTENIILYIKNLISMTTGECLFEGEWKIDIPVEKASDKIKTISNVNPITISMEGKQYSIKQVNIAKTALFMECDVKTTKTTLDDIFDDKRGINITIEYEDGSQNSDFYGVSNKLNQIFLMAWDTTQLENIKQIYIEGKKVFN